MSSKPIAVHSHSPNAKDLTRCEKNKYGVKKTTDLTRVTCKKCLLCIRSEKVKI